MSHAQQLSSKQNDEIIESLFGLPMNATAIVVPSSVHSTIIVTNALFNQVESYYVITDYCTQEIFGGRKFWQTMQIKAIGKEIFDE